MRRPRISDELADQITRKAEGLLEDTPVDAQDLAFERRLEIVFEAAANATSTSGQQSANDRDDEGEHPGGDAAAEELILDEL